MANGTLPIVPDAGSDPDGDWATNYEEYVQGTDPHDEGDGGYEVADPESLDHSSDDWDGDGRSNAEEVLGVWSGTEWELSDPRDHETFDEGGGNGTGTGGVTLTVSGSIGPLVVGQSVSGTLSAQGGTEPYVFSASGLPAGVSMSTSGEFSGQPEGEGTYAINILVSDAANRTGSLNISGTVTGVQPLTLNSSIGDLVAGEECNLSFGATGGRATLLFLCRWAAQWLDDFVVGECNGITI